MSREAGPGGSAEFLNLMIQYNICNTLASSNIYNEAEDVVQTRPPSDCALKLLTYFPCTP